MPDTCTAAAGGIVHLANGGQLLLQVTLGYSSEDPIAMIAVLALADGSDSRMWRFARDLMDSALSRPDQDQGEGDVMASFLSEQDVIRLTMRDDSGETHWLYFDAEPARRFMAASLALVPAENEALDDDDIDAEIARVLDGTWEL